ncbi:hypothetical protein AMJ40_02875 [candidate division TA06 bacterium DG_26]|uniref:Rrf2 family transcriptional regulator n=1 Tax=candidate division TA06 bacterium DG_26 TaxID=1703771 RepID=A0A0S7WJV9_UNCT6|nr:MAG: hypothetical protein AMJ40_02875 [candidate division TA06 bacterium DG_26]
MHITTRGRYALRAMLDLALHAESKPISLKEISQRQSISEKYLEQLFRRLRKAGLIQTQRGAHGGYLLGRRPELINMKEILRSAGECVTPVRCVNSVLACGRESECAVRLYWKRLDIRIAEFLESVTLSDLCSTARDGGIHA